MEKMKGSWIHESQIVEYYKYSLCPKKSDCLFVFQDETKAEEAYQYALKNKKQPTLTGFVKFYRKFIKNNIYETIIKRNKKDGG